MTITREHIYLAALLHDIGKFYQRADADGAGKSKLLSDAVKSLEVKLCPLHNEIYTHKHVLWTAQFFMDQQQHLQALLAGENKISADTLMNLSAAHHQPTAGNIYERIIQKADHYSSGADRSVIDAAWKDAEEEDDKKWDAFKRIKMRSIFEAVSLNEKDGAVWQADYKMKLPLMPVQLSAAYFPKAEDEATDYKKMWDDFEGEMKFLQSHSFRTFSETLLNLLEKYTSRIPSSTMHLPDVSLFDHSKTTAAFAVCLYDYMRAQSEIKIPAKDDKPFLLIGGDLSGIQKFIYGIIARGAAKNLKGRSFYLQLLIDNALKTLADKLSLFDANIIYSSGGGFYILAPNTEKVKNALIDFEKEIANKLFDFHKTDLYLAIDAVEFGESELYFHNASDKTIGDVWKELSEKLSRKKSQRFKDKLKSDFDLFFIDTKEAGAETKKDAITGEELGKKTANLDSYIVNEYTYDQIELGKKLRDVDYWVIADEEITYFKDKSFNPIGLGKYNYFVKKNDIEQREKELRASADKIRAYRINQLNFLEPAQKGIENIYGFNFYGGNKYPLSNWYESPKTFEELSGVEFADSEKEKRKKSPGLVRMSILRMDVDNLGTIFKKGLSADKRSFSRYSTLSRSLDYFFKGYLNEIWKSEKEFTDFTQIIYSGGDDLFIVGKWDVTIRLAQVINIEFRNYTCHSNQFTLSGGVAVVYPKFPLLKGAGYSELEEKNAKSHVYASVEKNAFSLFGYAFNWDNEFNYLVKLKEEIKTALENGELNQGFPSTVYNLMIQANFKLNTDDNKFKLTDYSVVWVAAYNFKRAIQRNASEKTNGFFMQWSKLIFTGKLDELPQTKYHALQYLALAARWADLEMR